MDDGRHGKLLVRMTARTCGTFDSKESGKNVRQHTRRAARRMRRRARWAGWRRAAHRRAGERAGGDAAGSQARGAGSHGSDPGAAAGEAARKPFSIQAEGGAVAEPAPDCDSGLSGLGFHTKSRQGNLNFMTTFDPRGSLAPQWVGRLSWGALSRRIRL